MREVYFLVSTVGSNPTSLTSAGQIGKAIQILDYQAPNILVVEMIINHVSIFTVYQLWFSRKEFNSLW
jgi:hypothetical protein